MTLMEADEPYQCINIQPLARFGVPLSNVFSHMLLIVLLSKRFEQKICIGSFLLFILQCYMSVT